MRVYQELTIRGPENCLKDTFHLITQALSNGWVRDKSAEETIRTTNDIWYCFRCSKTDQRREALLSLTKRPDGAFYVPNVVPIERGALTHDQYNGIIFEFCERFVRPIAAKTGATVELTSPDAELERWLSPEAATKLRRFSAAANKSTGSSHPSDQERWMVFLVSAHRENSSFDAHYLRRWLIEVERWPEEIVSGLVSEYEFGRELLNIADKMRGR